MSGWVLGIDPGVRGGLAVYQPGENRIYGAWDIPVHFVNKKDRLDLQGLRLFFSDLPMQVKHVFIERVGAMPGQGVASMFRFGEAYGVLQAMASAYSLPLEYAEPSVWKKAIGFKTRDKDEARQIAGRLFPDSAERWQRKKDHGRAEAVLLAVYGARRLAFTQRGYTNT